MQSATWTSAASVKREHPAIARGRAIWREEALDSVAAGAALCAVPVSIAICESLLAAALLAHIAGMMRGRAGFHPPRLFWLWLVWAGLEIAVWLHSPLRSAGAGEMRHLLLLAALFVVLPALNRPGYRLRVWRGVFLTATAGSLALIAGFVARAVQFQHTVAAGGDPGFYLRSGGLLHHWMVYATVEIVVFGALLEFRAAYPEERKWTTPVLGVNCLAVVLSLTRSLWIGCLIVLGLHLISRRSKWAWGLPALPVLAFLLAPGPLRSRMMEAVQPAYYSNAERVQMWRVGWNMIREHPLLGIGPGRVEDSYTRYLAAGEPVPAYHGHLHNNALQLAAQFGVPVLAVAMLVFAVLLKDLTRCLKRAAGREAVFLCHAGLMGVAGFTAVGMMDYTYGHSLGLILLAFAAISPLELISVHEKTNCSAWLHESDGLPHESQCTSFTRLI